MAFIVADRVRETCTSPGTGSVTLQGAVTGFQSFLNGIGINNTTYYVIADQQGNNWETGVGALSSSGIVLNRTTVLSSSNGGSLVPFSTGVQDVWVDYPATKAIYINASGNISPLGTITSATWNGTTIGAAYGGTGLTNFGSGGALYSTNGTSLTTGSLPVNYGGIGTNTLTGLAYGNGTSAFTAATASQIVTAIGTTAVTNATNATTATTATTATNIASGAAYQIPYQTGIGATSFISAPTNSTYLTYTTAGGYSWQSIINAGTTANSLTINNSGSGASSPSTFNGASAVTISYNTIGASPLAGSTSLTTVGTITTGTWNGTGIGVTYGGTGLATLTANAVMLGNGTSSPLFVAPSTSGNVLTSNGTTWQSTAPTGSLTLLGTITTTSGSSVSLTGLTLTGYKQLQCWFNGSSSTGSILFNSITITTATIAAYGQIVVDLATGGFTWNTGASGGGSVKNGAGSSGLTNSSTSITFTTGNAFNGGSINVYGVK
jgi:hypothetical protein